MGPCFRLLNDTNNQYDFLKHKIEDIFGESTKHAKDRV